MSALFDPGVLAALGVPTGKPQLLLVDDQPSNILILYEMFRADCDIFVATNGADALAYCQHTQPHLILLDVQMPDMDGHEVCLRLKGAALTRDIPVMFVTAQSDPFDEARGLDEGAADFIVKPLHAAVVRARVRTQLTLKFQSDLLRSLALNAQAAADKAMLVKLEFLSSMSHELRTPLNAVLGFSQLMATATPPPSATQQVALDNILQGGWQLLGLVDDILDLARIESGKLTLMPETLALSALLGHCQALIGAQAQQRAITVKVADECATLTVYADRNRLAQCVLNLLSNAIKYNHDGGSVTLDCAVTADGRARISVRDSGPGLTPDQVEQLFQSFHRLRLDTRAESGAGIGLAVTKQLIELMNGDIGVDSTPGSGSTFWLELPLATAP